MSRTAPRTLLPGDPLTRLDAGRRARDLDRLSRPLDVLVVGGGVTGAGVALDAASRGLSVALVERRDLAHGTSRWSSKLVHGGLRYLATGNVGVAWESAVERSLLATTIAPHLVRALPQLVPSLRGDPRTGDVLARAGFVAGDLLRVGARTPRRTLPRSRRVGATEALRLAPALDAARLRGGAVGWDGQLEDDARLVVALARTAAGYGAAVLTRTAAESLGDGGARLRLDDGSALEVRARAVVNATGVWAGELDPAVRLTPSRGTHVVLRAETLGHPAAALMVAVPGAVGRYVFALPEPDGLVYVGLTDVPVDPPVPDVPQASEEEVAWILDVLSGALARPLGRDDVVGTFAGLRPLLAPDHAGPSSADISRRHAVVATGGLVTVTGGKLTTYRRMAADVVDLLTDAPCRTTSLAAVGAGPVAPDPAVPARLVRRYGAEAGLVWSLGADDPSLRAPVAPGLPVLGCELAFGCAWEGARTAEDLLDRRTRLGLVPADAAAARPRAEEIAAAAAGPVPAP